MGSVSWKTTTPFHEDIHVALRRAQEETFSRGEYGFAHKMARLYASIGKTPPVRPEQPKASSRASSIELSAEDGTCSVLDVYEIGNAPAPGVVGPMTLDVPQPTKSFDSRGLVIPASLQGLGGRA